MQLFSCDNCQATIFFENFKCTSCGDRLAFLPDVRRMSALEETSSGDTEAPARFKALGAGGRLYRLCQNGVEHGACNWAVPDDDPEGLCAACRLNSIIPDLTDPEQRDAWLRLEAAKRRLLYSLGSLQLPIESRVDRPENGLSFSFVAGQKEQPVFTGHSDGLITINVAEAADRFREKVRTELGEAYRTVLGHFRHEIGHYYWDRLIKDSPRLGGFRQLFGDETVDYQESLERHYKEGPPPDWAERFVSPYASMHPWEDWAETWAHYLHMFDTLETAKVYGLRVRVGNGTASGEMLVDAAAVCIENFDQMSDDWIPLTLALNSLNRSMGLQDLYPFVLTEKALTKLRFVHCVIQSAGKARSLAAGNVPVAGENVVNISAGAKPAAVRRARSRGTKTRRVELAQGQR